MLKVSNLSISFIQYQSGLKQTALQVISDLSIAIQPGEILAVVGSSGSGKSLLAHAILGILPKNAVVSGTMWYEGKVLTPQRQKALRGKEITLIPQSVNYLDPLMRVGAQVRSSIPGRQSREQQRRVFDRYALKEHVGSLFPFQLSGGMARRVLAASAVIGGANLIIADEPTPGLHPEVVKETLGHLKELALNGCAVMLITHDIGTAITIADKIAVFYSGATIEVAPIDDFTDNGETLRHPYTKALWNALPQNSFTPIPGHQPSHWQLPAGCLFEPRCYMKTEKCSCKTPEMRELRSGEVRCHYAT